jgi:hypothetical protein
MRGVEIHGRQRHPRLHAALELKQVDLQVDGLRQLRLVLPQLPEFDNLSRF